MVLESYNAMATRSTEYSRRSVLDEVDGFNQGLDQLAFRRAEVWIPAVHQQDHPVLRRSVPGTVLVGVVEHHRLALDPGMSIPVHDVERTVVRDDQRKMKNESGVGHPVVRHDGRLSPKQ